MIDIKPYAASRLEALARVELSFPKSFGTVPVIVITETDNEAAAVVGNADFISKITIQLDVYGETAEQTEEIAVKANGLLTAAGFRRSFSETVYSEKYPIRRMKFTCGVNEVSGRILSL